MKLIVITRPEFFEGEGEAIDLLFRHGLDTLHLRKPTAPAAVVAQLLDRIPRQWHRRIMLHDVDLTADYDLQGLHLNHRRPTAPAGYQGCLSAACHSLDEVLERRDAVDYLFLSPIYDSISKAGYTARFTTDDLRQAAERGVIDNRVVALGGVTAERVPELSALGFGGVALLGDVWDKVDDRHAFVRHFGELRAVTMI